MKRILLLLFLMLSACFGQASAHEVRPAYLRIDQSGDDTAVVVWKQPTMGDVGIHLVPHMSNGWLEAAPTDQYAGGGYLVRVWNVRKANSLTGVRIDIEGLKDTMTDVLVRVNHDRALEFNAVVQPAMPGVTIPGNGAAPSRLGFLRLGIEHILTGYDHLLFVLGLLLIVPGRRALLMTITSFTVAHSITLAVSTLGQVNLLVPLLETLISLSILFLGKEVVRARQGGDSLTVRKPWIVAFAFGLLHGLGFASGLSELNLDRSELASALVLFNLGVEIGQLTFVTLVLSGWAVLQRMHIRWIPALRNVPVYLVGGLGAYWTLQNARVLFS